MNTEKLEQYTSQFWDKHITPTLQDYIKIPNKSPVFEPEWEQREHMEKVLQLAKSWSEKHLPQGAEIHIGREPGRTPLLIVDIPGKGDKTVLMYGHLDKQPEMTGWREDLGPWKPVIEGDKLYGRGGADDGYALFASLCAVKSLHEQGLDHDRVVVLIEFSEESGSPDLPFYVDRYQELLGKIDLVVCLDSGAGNYNQFWSTTSLRGMVACELKVEILREGVHSGAASGIVPSSFRIIRQLLARVEDPATGKLLLPELHTEIPEVRLQQAKQTGKTFEQEQTLATFPFVEGAQTMEGSVEELLLKRTWRPTLSYIGQAGMPPLDSSGSVLRPYTTLALSFRLPPTIDSEQAQAAIEKELLRDPPYGAKVSLSFEKSASGWNAPEVQPWLEKAIQAASQNFYGKEALTMGEGATIPFMGMLGEKFPEAQFIVTGVLGPESNAHGPNEFLHIPFAKKLTACVAYLLHQHFKQ